MDIITSSLANIAGPVLGKLFISHIMSKSHAASPRHVASITTSTIFKKRKDTIFGSPDALIGNALSKNRYANGPNIWAWIMIRTKKLRQTKLKYCWDKSASAMKIPTTEHIAKTALKIGRRLQNTDTRIRP